MELSLYSFKGTMELHKWFQRLEEYFEYARLQNEHDKALTTSLHLTDQSYTWAKRQYKERKALELAYYNDSEKESLEFEYNDNSEEENSPDEELNEEPHEQLEEEENNSKREDTVGGIIEKGGSIIQAIQNETGTKIKIVETTVDSEEQVVSRSVYEDPKSKHFPVENVVSHVQTRIATSGPDKGGMVTARFLVPSNQIGYFLGKSGAIFVEMRKASGTNINIFGRDQVPKWN
eukprot:Gb_11206 [translate_table: standard]